MKTLFRSTRRLLTLPVIAVFVAAGPVSADPPPPPMTVHLGDSGIVTDIFTTHVTYVGVHNTLLSSFGRRLLDASPAEQPPLPSGAVLPHGTLRAIAHSEKNDEDYLYLNLIPSVNFSALSVLQTNVSDDGFFPIRYHPFNNVYFTTTEPLHYGIESEIEVTHTNDGSGAALGVSLTPQDPGPNGGLAQRLAFGDYRSLSNISSVLDGGLPGGAVYAKVDAQGTADDLTEGIPNGILAPGHYSVTAALNFDFWNRIPGAQPPNPDFITGAMNLTSSGEVWVIIGKAAGWKRSQDGDYTASAPWIAQHEPLPDYHVFFKRPNGAYSVSGITGTVRSFSFAGGEQQVTLTSGNAEATEEILVADDTVILQGTTLNTPTVKIQAANANLIVQNGSHLRADPSTTGEMMIGGVLNQPSGGRLTVEEGGQARAGIVTLGRFSGGGGGVDFNDVSETMDPSRSAAVSESPLSDGAVAAALTENDTGAGITGTAHVGSDAYGSGAELAVAQRLHVLGSAKLESVNGVVDNTSDPDAMKLQGGQWNNSDNITIGKSHDATVQVINGGQIDTESLIIGKDASGHGTVNVQSSVIALVTTVGDSGEGNLLGSNSANLQLGTLVIGHNTGSHGTVMIQSGSTLTTGGTIVGDSGQAELTMSGNSNVSTQALNIAQKAGSIGSMLVSDSTLTVENLGGVGKGGSGLLELFGVSVLQGSGVLDIGEHGIVRLRQGTTASGFGFNIESGGRLEVTDGASFVNEGNGFICQNGGSVLFSNSHGNNINASFTIESVDAVVTNGSTIDVLDVIVAETGTLTVSGAGTRMTVGDTLDVNGTLVISTGALIEGASDMVQLALGRNAHVSGSGGSLRFANINNPFSILLPGSSPGTMTLDGDYVQGAGGMIEIEIGGTTPGVDYDQLIITGNATINGIIVLKFINGYTPAAGQQFNIIDTGGSFTGSPRVIVQGLAPGWQFTTGFDVLSDEFRINSTSNGVAGPPPSTDINNLDGDADSNFMEFAFGTDPAVSDSGVMQVIGNALVRRGSPTVSTANNSTSVHFCRRKNHLTSGLTYTGQFSADLVTWQDSIQPLTVVASDAEFDAVSVPFPELVEGKPARFFRMALSAP